MTIKHNTVSKKRLQRIALAAAVAVAINGTALSSYADDALDEIEASQSEATLNQSAGISAGMVLGAIVGGPIGAIVGAVSGTYVGTEMDKADQYVSIREQHQKTKAQLLGTQTEIAALKEQLAIARLQQRELHALAMDNLEFQVLFHTGQDELDGYTLQRLDDLADFLKHNPDLIVQLHGYADPRGTDGYNKVLSTHRAINVQDALEVRGIDTKRIQRQSHGADLSQAPKGDLDAYALERRVSIEIINPNQNSGMANIK